MKPGRSALLIVDVQNDFCPGGALAVSEGDQVVAVLNRYIERFRKAGLPIYASRDWHPTDSRHFQERGGVWPQHCVQGTHGAEFHPDLQLPADAEIVTKGSRSDEDGYTAFEGRLGDGSGLAERLKKQRVDHLYVGGLATDYCVRASALDARKVGLQVTLLADAVRGVNLDPDDSSRAVEEMRRAGVEVGTAETLDLPR